MKEKWTKNLVWNGIKNFKKLWGNNSSTTGSIKVQKLKISKIESKSRKTAFKINTFSTVFHQISFFFFSTLRLHTTILATLMRANRINLTLTASPRIPAITFIRIPMRVNATTMFSESVVVIISSALATLWIESQSALNLSIESVSVRVINQIVLVRASECETVEGEWKLNFDWASRGGTSWVWVQELALFPVESEVVVAGDGPWCEESVFGEKSE